MRNDHDVEMAQIKTQLDEWEMDRERFELISAAMTSSGTFVSAADKAWFKEAGTDLSELNQKVATSESAWQIIVREYEAMKAETGTPKSSLSTHSDSRDGGNVFWDEDRNALPLMGTSMSDATKNRPTSAVARRIMCKANYDKYVQVNFLLNTTVMRNNLLLEAKRLRFGKCMEGADGLELQLGGHADQGQSITARVSLTMCPVFLDEKKFNMAVGKTEFEESELCIYDFVEAKDAKDCERLVVLQSAARGFVEFVCWAFGEHLRATLGQDVLDTVNSTLVERATEGHVLFIAVALGRAFADFFNILRHTLVRKVQDKVTGVWSEKLFKLNGLGWIEEWQTTLKRWFNIKPYTMHEFAGIEGEFRAQLVSRFSKGSKRAAGPAKAEDSGSDGDRPKKKARNVASSPARGEQARYES